MVGSAPFISRPIASAGWTEEGLLFDSQPARQGSLSAIGWQGDDQRRHERAYLATNSGLMFVRAIDQDLRSWALITSGVAYFDGPLAAIRTQAQDIVIGAIATRGSNSGDRTLALVTPPAEGEAYGGDISLVAQPQGGLGVQTDVAAALDSDSYCFFVRTQSGKLGAYRGGSSPGWTLVDAPTSGTSFQPAVAAGRWAFHGDQGVAAFVVDTAGAAWELRWSQRCSGPPVAKIPLGRPSSSLPIPGAAHSVATYTYPSGAAAPGQGRELVVAVKQNAIWGRTSDASGNWGDWTKRSSPVDAYGALGGVALFGDPQLEGAPRLYYVGDSSKADVTTAGYVFEQNEHGLENHTHALAGLSKVNTSGAWTESSMDEVDGKVVLGATVLGPPADPERVAVGISLDDGETWRALELPAQLSSPAFPADTIIARGDPVAAMGKDGTGHVGLCPRTVQRRRRPHPLAPSPSMGRGNCASFRHGWG